MLCSAPGLYLSAVGGKGWAVSLVWTSDLRFYVVSLEDVTAHAQQGRSGPWDPDHPERPLGRNECIFPWFLDDKYSLFTSAFTWAKRELH